MPAGLLLADLIARNQRMPQVGQGWMVDYAVFAHWGFTDTAHKAAREFGARLVTLKEMEGDLVGEFQAEG